MNVLLVEPMKEPRAVQIESGLEPLQNAVGGDIQAVYPFSDPIAIITNDEGKIMGLPLNRALRDEEGKIYDVLAGNFLIVGLGGERFTDLPPELMEKYKVHFKHPEQFFRMGEEIFSVKRPVPSERKEKKLHQKQHADAR